jgi:hypothetical protein
MENATGGLPWTEERVQSLLSMLGMILQEEECGESGLGCPTVRSSSLWNTDYFTSDSKLTGVSSRKLATDPTLNPHKRGRRIAKNKTRFKFRSTKNNGKVSWYLGWSRDDGLQLHIRRGRFWYHNEDNDLRPRKYPSLSHYLGIGSGS